MNMNVLHVSQTDIRFDSRILKELMSLNNTGRLNLFGLGGALDEGNEAGDETNTIHIDSISLLSRKVKYFPRILRHLFEVIEIMGKFFIRGVKFKPQVIHAHDVVVLPVCVLIKIFTGSNLIYDAHELESDRNGLTPVLSKMTIITERLLWPFVDAFITVSQSICDWYMLKLGKKDSEIILNSPVYDADGKKEVTYPNDYLQKTFNIDKSETVFIYVGILSKGRGVELLLETFKSLTWGHIVFMGYGDLEARIREVATHCKRIHFHQAVKHSNVVSIVKTADVGICLIENVSLSDYYCLPNKLFEYAFANVKVIASDFPEIANVVKKHNLGKCCKLDSESICDAVMEFENKETMESVNVEKLYELSWEAQEVKLVKLYNRLLFN